MTEENNEARENFILFIANILGDRDSAENFIDNCIIEVPLSETKALLVDGEALILSSLNPSQFLQEFIVNSMYLSHCIARMKNLRDSNLARFKSKLEELQVKLDDFEGIKTVTYKKKSLDSDSDYYKLNAQEISKVIKSHPKYIELSNEITTNRLSMESIKSEFNNIIEMLYDYKKAIEVYCTSIGRLESLDTIAATQPLESFGAMMAGKSKGTFSKPTYRDL